jgi:hypothetical protein
MADQRLPDIQSLLEAKSDQTNAADLVGAGVTGTIVHMTVNLEAKQQAMTIWLDCLPRNKPWKPCKTALRILSHGWKTTDPNAWLGRRVQLYYEEDVHFEKQKTGGIRVQAMSHTKPFRISLAEKRGKFRMWEIGSLPDTGPRQDVSPPDLDTALADLDLTAAEVDAYLLAEGRPVAADLDDSKRAALAGALPKIADKIRARRTP